MRKVKWGILGTADIAWGQTIPGMKLAEHVELYAIAGRKPDKVRRCILTGEKPHVTKEFSLQTARVTDRILKAIGY